MSLGFRLLWRARSYAIRVKELSPIPREQHNPFSFEPERPSSRRWLSTPIVEETLPDSPAKRLQRKSHSALSRALRRIIIKQRSGFDPKQHVLVKPPVEYPDRRRSLRSLRQHRRSVARQLLSDVNHEAASNPASHWRLTLNFMLRHTRNFGKTLNFRVIIGRGIAAEAYKVLSEPDTNLSQIRRRNESLIHIEEVNPKNGELVLQLSGSEDSVRKSLVDIVGIVGRVTAVRVSDPSWKSLLLDVWKSASEKQPGIQLIADGNMAIDDKTVTVQASVLKPPKYKHYLLTKRADKITRPTKWTKVSFEKYVDALVHGRVPTHLARSLYPHGPNHQETVVTLLLDLFTSEESRSAASVSALKLAVNFIESRGSGFRQASRSIFNEVDSLNLPMDAEIFNAFLVSASKARDLNSFDRILKMMIRKGCALQGGAWAAFLAMIENPSAKSYIAAKLSTKRLTRNPLIRRAIGRQMAILNLERCLSTTEFDIEEFLQVQNRKYGIGWLDTMTLHRIMDILGKRDQLKACDALWDLVCTEHIASPDVVLLNTMLTNARSISQSVAIVQSVLARARQSMPWLKPDQVTNNLLFRAAWTRRYPNMLRVIWRYAALAQSTHSKMRHRMTQLLRQKQPSSARRAFLKDWESVIFGQAELAEMRACHSDNLNAMHLISKYEEQGRGMRPSVPFETKLGEALAMDVKIHRLLREGTVVSASMRESLSVDIPLRPTTAS
ncbi:hypothetical protein F4818DRAFT_423068 [Hypoxylon cercidicola]|nr:hypothetical protein F4818DRAFT_423068 [Hypoxylon cercidicola]